MFVPLDILMHLEQNSAIRSVVALDRYVQFVSSDSSVRFVINKCD